MLSRRNVRVKVMQMLFTLSRDEELRYGDSLINYRKLIKESYELLLFSIYNLMEITEYAKEDEKKRKAKHLPNDYDKAFKAKLFNNPLITSLVKNHSLHTEFVQREFASKIDKDYCRKIYTEFSKEEAYKLFIQSKSDNKAYLEILLELFRFCRRNELFNEVMEDKYPVWLDDKSLIIGAVKKWLKALPSDDPEFFKAFYPDEETIKTFGEELLEYTHKEDDKLLTLVKPVLENWDHERVAIVDMILIKMALAELLSFKSIPANVTLNEYVEVSKQYSTAKSKDFINGILDKLTKSLEEQGLLQK